MITKQELIDFEADIAREFEAGRIKAPVHLHGGNEDQLIQIFREIREGDWVFSTHRSHYHALLHGIPPGLVKSAIIKGDSIHLWFPRYHFWTSAIVAGIVPIALGAAMAGKRCWVFVGDMAAETGIFHECVKYAHSNNLPIKFVVEDNGFSVDTPTRNILRYSYERVYPHQGVGKFILF